MMNRRKFTGMGRQIAAQQRAQPQMPMGGGIGAALGRIGQRPGFVNSSSFVNPGPAGPPPAGMAPVDPSKAMMMKKGGAVKKMAKGGTASKRADGCATKGKTKGRFV
jgi:hypothetical protein